MASTPLLSRSPSRRPDPLEPSEEATLHPLPSEASPEPSREELTPPDPPLSEDSPELREDTPPDPPPPSLPP